MPAESELRTFYEHNYRLAYKGVHRPKRKHIFRHGLAASRSASRSKTRTFDSASSKD